MKTETWKAIPGLDHYEASDMGRVRSYLTKNGRGVKVSPHIMAPLSIKGKDYLRYGFRKDGKTVWMKAHIVTLITFVGPRPSPKHDGCHNDGNAHNNAVSNVRWDTKKGNAADRIKHGTQTRGEDIHKAVLTEEQVAEIKAALPVWKYGTGRSFAKKFGVSESAIHDVKSGRTWSHV